jgi:16S rRNA (guanine527-N7)-methyltransferase
VDEAAVAARLHEGVVALGISLPPGAEERLLAYEALVRKWDRVYNLVGTCDPMTFVERHLLDCLAILPHVPAGRLLDLGSGAGLPGMVLALARPEQDCLLVDSNGKKTRFLTQICIELGLPQVRVMQAELQRLHPPPEVAVVTVRAFSSLEGILKELSPLAHPGLTVLLMKGAAPAAEVAALPAGGPQATILPLTVPGLREERHLVRLDYI